MMMRSLLIVLVLCPGLPAFCQYDVRFKRITVEEGLSQSSIKSMVQDRYGYLWIGTLDGLNRYDGNEFHTYKYDKISPNSIPRNDIHQLFIDHSQNLWVSTVGYLSRYSPGENNFANYPVILNGVSNTGFVTHDLYQKSDSVLILASNQGLWYFNTLNFRFSRDEAFKEFDTEEVRNFEEIDGTTWVVTTRGVYTRGKNSKQFVSLLNLESRISFYYSAPTKEIYVLSGDHLYKFDFQKNTFKTIYTFPPFNDVDESHMGLLKMQNGELWVMLKEILLFDSTDTYLKTLRYIKQDPFTLSSDYLACILETRDGVVWIGTNGMGLNKYSPQFSVFNYFGSFPGAPISLTNNFVTAVATRDDNEIYVATVDGLDIINLKEEVTHHYKVIAKDGKKARINKLLLDDASNDIWIATSNGLLKWNGKAIILTGNAEFDNPNTAVNDLFFLSPHELLIATTTGTFVMNRKTLQSKRLTTTGTLTFKLMDNFLWTDRYGEIIRYDTTHYQPLPILTNSPADSTSFPDAVVKCFYQDTEGKIWIGTSGGGLALFDPVTASFKIFTEKNGLPNGVIYGILEDDSHNLWVSTNRGIAIFSKRDQRCIRNYTRNHGIQGDEFNTNAFFKSSSGKMYFGGVAGLTAFYPGEAIAIKSEVPLCAITDLYISGERKEFTENQQSLGAIVNTQQMELSWDERNFGFQLSSLGFSYPAHTAYQYMLRGYENSWTLMENKNRITFTNIPPGDYSLLVKTSNSFGEWGKESLILNIKVKPPLWKTFWFRLLIAGLILTIFVITFRRRTRALRRRTDLLEQQVRERTRTLQIQQEEIAAQNEELTAQSELMDQRNTELENAKISLEERVEERTMALKKLNEELIDQNLQLEQFAFITAHNIRGPVARIKGLINLVDHQDNDIIARLIKSADDLDEVISDLNTVLNIRKGSKKMNERVELRSLLLLAIDTLADEIAKVKGTVDISAFQEVSVNGLRPYLYSILYNLIHNALKYSSHERPVLIQCTSTVSENLVTIVVKDNGIGIDMRYAKDKIFNLYQRFHPEVAGKGFGLFLTRTQLEAMNGRIAVDSVLNEGTQFTIELPRSQ